LGSAVFHFKQFSVVQGRSAMKVGTDGVLLGAWVPVEGASRILDAGTGTGLIALMLAQRQPEAVITGIDVDEGSCSDASLNFENSPWRQRLEVVHTSLQEFALQKACENTFDLIVSNPPYFNRSLPAQTPGRTLARHNDTLGPADIIVAAKRLLRPAGKLALILPVSEYVSFGSMAKESGMYEHRKMAVSPVPSKPAHRIMSCWGLAPAETCLAEELTIEEAERHQYTADYVALTRDFYLNMSE
jgi:tRNA1Val (adenine37-N6)-methyltransferase